MKIHKLRLKNFRGFIDNEFNLTDSFNVFIGDNGTGKTAILDATDIAIGSLFLSFNEISPRHIRDDEVRRVNFEHGGALQVEPQYPVSVYCEGEVNGNEIFWERTLNNKEGRTTRINAKKISIISRELQEAVREGKDIDLPILAYYGTGRLWLQKKEKSVKALPPGSRMEGYVDALDPQSNEKMLVKWFRQRELAVVTKKKPSEQLEAVKQAVSESLGKDFSIYYDFDAEELIIKSDTGQVLPYHFFSDGVRNMVGMVADIAYRSAVLNPHMGKDAAHKTPGIVLIDEIDLHLHPKWQRRVVDDLRRAFPEIQFFATTHSPFIIQSLKPGELHDLNDGIVGEYSNKSIEDIVEREMDVPIPQRSERYQRMYDAARRYYELLQESKKATPDRIAQIKSELDELTAPFSDNVAYHAFLDAERIAARLGR